MKASTFTSVPLIRFRAWLFAATALLLNPSVAAAAAIYSNTGAATASRVCLNPVACLALGEGVDNAGFAADNVLDNFATLYKGASVGSTVSLRLGLGGTGQVGDRAGVLVAPGGSLLTVSALGTYTLVTYKNGVEQESRVVSAAVVQSLRLLAGAGRPTQLEFVANAPFDEVKLEVTGTATALYSLNVYYAYSVPSLIRTQVKGALSKFATTGSGLQPYYGAGTSNVGVVSACVLTGIKDPELAVDNDLTNYAQFLSGATVGCPSALAVRLAVNQPVPAGYYAGFVVGTGGLLDLGALSGLRVSTYLNGAAQESATDIGLLELRVLPDSKYQLSFPTTLPFNEVKIESLGTVTALNNLRIYYGFGVEPTAFQATTPPVRSDFATPPTSSYAVTGSSLACVTFSSSCTVINAANAADNDLTNFASIRTTVALAAANELKLTLNGTPPAGNNGETGLAGNRAGVVLGFGAGLLDVTALNNLTLTTYDQNNRLIESASGSSLLSLNALASNKQEVSFLTTQPFSKVQLSVAGGVALAANLAIYYAFTDDRTGGLPSVIVPLPVSLSAFTAKWNNGAADLNWATASEKNSSYFAVERSAGGETGFRTVGQLPAAGSSASPKTYGLRDAEAGAQGVSILYYRLRLVDADGQTVFSPLVSVAVGKAVAAPQLAVYPNPAPDAQAVTLQCFNLPAAGATVLTYSEMGQLVSQLTVTEAATRLVLPALAPGLYHLVLRNAAGQPLAAQRLVVGNK